MFGVCTIDNCLWDLRGKFFDTPVYKLPGGPCRRFMRVGMAVFPMAVGIPRDMFSLVSLDRNLTVVLRWG